MALLRGCILDDHYHIEFDLRIFCCQLIFDTVLNFNATTVKILKL